MLAGCCSMSFSAARWRRFCSSVTPFVSPAFPGAGRGALSGVLGSWEPPCSERRVSSANMSIQQVVASAPRRALALKVFNPFPLNGI